jgi:hypothetical protein
VNAMDIEEMDINLEIDLSLMLLSLAISLGDDEWVTEVKEWLAELVDVKAFIEDGNN